MKVPEVAERLSVSRAFVYELIAAGEIPTARVGHAVRVPEAELDAYVRRLVNEQRERSAGMPIGSTVAPEAPMGG